MDQHLFWSCLAIGFGAQFVAGCLGMGYSVTISSVLLSMGISPSVTSASVHTSEVVNRLLSGLAHYRYGNVEPRIFKQLALYGMAGAFIGAFVVVYMPVSVMRPLVAAGLLIMGLRILLSAFRQLPVTVVQRTRLGLLGFVGGLVDVIGGGGWGPVVTATLILQGKATNLVVGSINFAKFFVAVVESVTLLVLLKSPNWLMIAGLIGGGALAAPVAAYACSRVPKRLLTLLVGCLVSVLSLRTLVRALG